MKNFFRKVAFGLKPDEKIPSDPLVWATSQITDKIPDFTFKGKIYSEEELRKHYRDWVFNDRKKLRKKFKKDKKGYKSAKNKLRADTGQKFWRNLELAIRHKEATMGSHPVLAKLWYFWGNHFTISDKDFLSHYTTGAYQRETIRLNMNQTFEKLAHEATVAWAMIHHLDNAVNVGPKSKDAKADWRKRKKRPATINENHARELLELHTVSPNSGYTQENITELAMIMTGWAPNDELNKSLLETASVKFQRKYHQPGKKLFWGKEFPKGKKGLPAAIKFLANHKSCREFIAYKLCRYLITDYPTKDMTDPIVKAWEINDGFLPEVHKAAIKVAFEFNDKHNKFQTPENWWLQMGRMTDAKWPPSDDKFDTYQLGYGPDPYQAKPHKFMKDMGHHPYLSQQPNGFSDLAEDWMSPELIIRRFLYARQGYINLKPDNKNDEFFEKVVTNNFDNPEKIMKILNKNKKTIDKHILLFNLPEVLRA
ncbi:DUF1800 family protein [Candidatus Pelagibacter bacterium nBUS_49]|uniref:DUF1800 family protein n=1 Tax=Candidatus Pelagibacter bacterium nBUS_49 TaxID=3374196 RepID=UPI003EBEE7EA